MTHISGKNNLQKWHLLFPAFIILIFILSKIPYLNFPFYWDEAWVYAPAIQYMAEHGLSLHPASLPVELSRGHPLLFHFLGAGWISLFGDSLISIHSFALFISCLLLFVLYLFVKRYSNTIYALAAIVVFCLLRAFFVQSVFVLPEILFALFGLLTVWAFIERKHWLVAIFGALMIMTKESGLAIMGILFIVELAFIIKGFKLVKKQLNILLAVVASLLPFGIFLWVQYLTHGWFFYPEHTGYLDLDFNNILMRLHALSPSIFSDFGISSIIYISLICFIWWLLTEVKSTPKKIIAILGVAIFITLFMSRGITENGTIIRTGILCFTGLSILLFFLLPDNTDNRISRICWTLFAVVFGFIVYTSMNFFSYRYLLVIFPLVVALPFIGLYQMRLSNKWLVIPFVIICLSLVPFLSSEGKFGDTDPSYINMVKAHQEMVRYMLENVEQSTPLRVNFLPMVSLSQSGAGYLNEEQEYENFVWDNNYQYLISINNEFDELAMSEGHELIREIEVSEANIKIYEHKK